MVYDKVIKKRVSFALPEDTKEQHLRLKSPAARTSCNTATASKNQGKRKGDTEAPSCSSSSNHNRRSKHSVQKCFVRNAEMPVSKSTKSVGHAHASKSSAPTKCASILKNPLPPDQIIRTDGTTNIPAFTSKYSVPELYSSLSVAKQIKFAAEEHKKQISITEMPLLIKKQIEGKAASKHDIPFEEQIFHDLVTLNVCGDDEEIVSREEEKSLSEDVEPSLLDFHQLKIGEEYLYDYKPLPCTVEKVRRFNGLSVYNKMQRWENKTK